MSSSGPTPQQIQEIFEKQTLTQDDQTVVRKFLGSRIGEGFSIGSYLQTIRTKYGVEIAQQLCPGIGAIGVVNAAPVESHVLSESKEEPINAEMTHSEAPPNANLGPETAPVNHAIKPSGVGSKAAIANPMAKVTVPNPLPGSGTQANAKASVKLNKPSVESKEKTSQKLAYTRTPEELKKMFYNIQLTDIPGWACDKSSKKAKLHKSGRMWCRQICYVLARNKLDTAPFIDRLKIFFTEDDMSRLIEFTSKAVERADQANVENKQQIEPSKTDDETNDLIYLANHMKRSDIPGMDDNMALGNMGLYPEAIRWIQDKIRRLMSKNLYCLDSFLLRVSDMFRTTIHFVFSRPFRRELNATLLPAFLHNADRLRDLMKKAAAMLSVSEQREMPLSRQALLMGMEDQFMYDEPQPLVVGGGRIVTNTGRNNGFQGSGIVPPYYSSNMMQRNFGYDEDRNIPFYPTADYYAYNNPMRQSMLNTPSFYNAASSMPMMTQRGPLLGHQPMPNARFPNSRPLPGYVSKRMFPSDRRFSPYTKF